MSDPLSYPNPIVYPDIPQKVLKNIISSSFKENR